MSSQAQSGPTPTGSASGGGVALPPTPEKLQQALDHGIWYALSLWPALHVACQNHWGGEATLDKKDWFAGAVSDLFTARPDLHYEELECFLLQVMQDEFDCNVEDESEVEVGRTIIGLKKRLVEERDLGAVRDLEVRFRNRGQMKVDVKVVEHEEEDGDDGEEWEGFQDGEDEEMGGVAPQLVPAAAVPAVPRVKEEPEVDDDGFTKVVGKKKR
ncbi:hypothetical protein B0A50_01305 [Salinomyces thailandicus]|uniref:Pre-rRNA-processing protein TSR2 n=1 Tax=Salinomyces thailandicus TaxID=706561 RepID=A0A4V5N810_9PEZI|nr:hypothetical protein B0A50_01305 [Salinomyces thailandica]